MKKVFCMSFLLFATTLSFSATTAKTDKLVNKGSEITLPTLPSDMPVPEPGCKNPPGDCPGDPK